MVTRQQWIKNILEVVEAIADRETQESRWLAPDAYAWECPDELINSLDDVVFEGFVDQFATQLPDTQRAAMYKFRECMDAFNNENTEILDSAKVLRDPKWQKVRDSANAFIEAFEPEVDQIQ